MANTEQSHHLGKFYWAALLQNLPWLTLHASDGPISLLFFPAKLLERVSSLLVISTSPPPFLSWVRTIQVFTSTTSRNSLFTELLMIQHFAKASGQCPHLVQPLSCIGCRWSHSPSNTFFSELLEDHTVLVLLLPKWHTRQSPLLPSLQ